MNRRFPLSIFLYADVEISFAQIVSPSIAAENDELLIGIDECVEVVPFRVYRFR